MKVLPPLSTRSEAVKTPSDSTNLDSVAYTIVGLGVVGWILTLLLR